MCLRTKSYLGQLIFIIKQYESKNIPHINVCFYLYVRKTIDDFLCCSLKKLRYGTTTNPPTNQALYAPAAYESKHYIALMYPQEP